MAVMNTYKNVPAGVQEVVRNTERAKKAFEADPTHSPKDYYEVFANRSANVRAMASARANGLVDDPQDSEVIKRRVAQEAEAAVRQPLIGGPGGKSPMASSLPAVLHRGMQRDDAPLNFGGYFRALATGNWTGLERERQFHNAMTTGGDGSGLVPQTITSEVWFELLGRLPITEAGARVITLANGSIKVPVEAASPAAAWVAEGAEISDSGGEFDEANLTPRKIAFLVTVSNELLIDAPQVADQHIRQAILNALTRGLNAGFLNGSGTDNQPLGLLNGTPTWATDVNAELDHDVLVQAFWDIAGAGGNPSNIRAIMAPGAAKHLDTIRTDEGDGTFLTASAPMQLPRVVTNAVSTETNTKVLVADFAQAVTMYTFGGMRFDVDTSAAFNKDSVVFRCVQRVDLAVNQPSLIKRLDGLTL